MLLHSESGEVLARGQAKLALVDRSCNKPCLPTPERLAAYQPELRTAFADKLPRLRPPAGCNAESPVQLRRSDMDYNGHLHNTAYLALALHLHNTAYLALALDAAPADVTAGGVHTFRISYRSPLRLGDAPTLQSCPQSGGWAASFVRAGEVCAVVAVNEQLTPLSGTGR